MEFNELQCHYEKGTLYSVLKFLTNVLLSINWVLRIEPQHLELEEKSALTKQVVLLKSRGLGMVVFAGLGPGVPNLLFLFK